jgi:exopolysaccharide/PEP-CTERM locus tyrosine autokinase
MSRIEEALEKAAKLRGNQNSTAAPQKAAATAVHFTTPAVIEGGKVTNRLLVAVSDPHTPVAEEYRKLKSILVKLTRGETFRNMLMITSSVSCEGKSVTALNLALTLAQDYDHTVLLIDADLRKPSLHDYLGIEKRAGLSECLRENLPIKDALLRTGVGKLSLLPAGSEVRNPAEIFSSHKARELFQELKHRYPDRYIIVDSPPVLPFAETRSLSAIVDGVVLVVKEGMVPLQHVAETLDCLRGVNLLGVVYNEATVESQKDYNQYYRLYSRSYADAL